ncbi:MAG: hypothetical protein KAS72_11025 [Phycisphaerales bacterium]|nr:hypothetical protein [Phycisphaerales bacterium]
MIKLAGEFAGFATERSDEHYSPETVPTRIQQLLSSAAVLVADISDGNANVYYELGLAHANRKPVILLARRGAAIPFDLVHWMQLKYDNPTDIKSPLADALQGVIDTLNDKKSQPSKDAPRDLEVGQLAVKCGMLTPSALERAMSQLYQADCQYASLLDLLIDTSELDAHQSTVLRQVQEWVGNYLEGVSRSLSEPVWLRQLHRTVTFLTWRCKEEGATPAAKRHIHSLDKTIDVFDEAVYVDYILAQKLQKATFTARSTGVIVLHEMETDKYRCSVPSSAQKYYKTSGGGALDYEIAVRSDAPLPVLVERTLTYLNGFQISDSDDNRECGIRASQPVEDLMLKVDFSRLDVVPTDVVAELRSNDESQTMPLKRASDRCYYAQCLHPERGAALYIKWKWD